MIVRHALMLLLMITLLTGVLYPLTVTGIARTAFLYQVDGSPLADPDGSVRGSALIGQPFSDPRFFWGRPSATARFPYNASSSAGSNRGPTNPDLVKAAEARIAELVAADPASRRPVPIELVTASASGLDPHISPAAALYQVPRVAKARNLDEAVVRDLVLTMVKDRPFGILGEPVVPVLELNLALEGMR